MVNFKQCSRDVFRRKQFMVIRDLWEEGPEVIVVELPL